MFKRLTIFRMLAFLLLVGTGLIFMYRQETYKQNDAHLPDNVSQSVKIQMESPEERQRLDPQVVTPHGRTSRAEFDKRLQRIRAVCSSLNQTPGYVHAVLTHESGVIYCYVPKAGCTFWKRFFTVVRHYSSTENISSISGDHSRIPIHQISAHHYDQSPDVNDVIM